MADLMDIDGPNGGSRPQNGVLSTAKVSDTIALYRPTKVFVRDGPASVPGKASSQSSILSLDFDDEGHLLLTSESDNSLQIYNLREGKHQKTHLSQKYGVMHAMFAHAPGCIIHSSTKQNHIIRYLSTHDNSYLRYFEGHEGNVTCLSLHPGQDTFISCSEDNTVRIWDAGTKNASGRLDLNGAYLAAWDPSGNVFALASPIASSILLYDLRNFDKEPFATFDMLPHLVAAGSSGTGTGTDHRAIPSLGRGWNKLEFSNDGKSILLGTTGPAHLLVDAFDGSLKATLRRDRGGARTLAPGDHELPPGTSNTPDDPALPSTGDCCFTPDGRYVLSGSGADKVLVWDTLDAASSGAGGALPTPVGKAAGLDPQARSLRPKYELEHKKEAAVLAFNPRYNFFVTADRELVFWVPDPNA